MKLRKDDIPSMKREYDYTNLDAARLLAAEPERYPGAMQTWAHLTLERLKDLPPRRVTRARKGQQGLGF